MKRNVSQPPRITAQAPMRPGLFDRLTDHEPDRPDKAESRHGVSQQTLRQQVLRDLQWLFNAINHEAQRDMTPWPQARASVINFGVEPLAGKRISDVEWSDIQQKLLRAIHTFEPRIMPDGLEVRCLDDMQSLTTHNVLSIEIRGNLWCAPWPLAFLFRTELDLEHGRYQLQDIG